MAKGVGHPSSKSVRQSSVDKDILIWPAEVYFIQIKSPEVELFILIFLAPPITPWCVLVCVFLCLCLYVIQMKLPSSVGQKKIKAIEQILMEQGVGKCRYLLAACCNTFTSQTLLSATFIHYKDPKFICLG